MLITEKVRASLGGNAYRVFEISAVSGGIGYTLSAGALGMNYVKHATYTPTVAVLSAGSTTYPTVYPNEFSAAGQELTLSAHAVSGEGGVLTVWGY